MIKEQNLARRNWRAAQSIHDELTGAGWLASLPTLPTAAWDNLCHTSRMLALAMQRGWRAAGQSVLEDLDYVVQRLERELQSYRQQLPSELKSNYVVSTREIATDLAALREEFSDVSLSGIDQQIGVLIEPIELEGTSLGRFRIVLRWNEIRSYRAYDVVATEPCPAQDNDEVTHPHVRDGELCEGEGAAPIKAALSQGRIFDFFLLVRQILETYNPGSAHIALGQWDGVSCSECGGRMSSDERSSCERCNAALCGECSSSCQGCERYVCTGCANECTSCDENFCASCLRMAAGSNQGLCQSCLETNQEDECDDVPKLPEETAVAEPQTETSPASKADPLCLGEAAVPA